MYSLKDIAHFLFELRIKYFSEKQTVFAKGAIVGVIASLFVLPSANGPYVPFVKIISEKMNASSVLAALSVYNFLFIIPLALFMLVVSYLVKKEEARRFYRKNKKIIRIIYGIAMVFTGAYIVQVSF